jgi:hypothetical protein
MGMGQRMLPAIQAIYANDTACVQTAGGLTEACNCNIGVKQGCISGTCPAYSCIREKFEHFKLRSYTDVATLFKECSGYKELAKFTILCRESRNKLLRS